MKLSPSLRGGRRDRRTTAAALPAAVASVLLLAPCAYAQPLAGGARSEHRLAPPVMKFDAHGSGGSVSGMLVTAGPIAPSDLTCTTSPGSVSNALSSVNIQGIASLAGISTSASGTTDAGGLQTSAAQAATGKLSLMGGLIAADAVSANANATDNAAGTVSTAGNVTLTNLKVAGSAVTATAPNTTINLLIGTVVVNEQISTAGGGGIAVNAIHAKLLGGTVDIVVGHAAAALVPVGSACPVA